MKKAKKIELVNAKQVSLENPDTFNVPPDELLDNLQIGDICKICDNRERFWVLIRKVKKDGFFEGTINNYLVGNMMNEIIKKEIGKYLLYWSMIVTIIVSLIGIFVFCITYLRC